MKHEFVPYEQSLALKELGFDEPCLATWNGETLDMSLRISSDDCFTKAPTFSQAFRWFREKYNLKDKYGVFPHHTIMFNYIIGGGKEEEAELACLIKLIEITNEGKRT